jgi:hypothetical protein
METNISTGINLSREISRWPATIRTPLNQIYKQYNFKISKEETKVIAFWGKYPIRSKIVLQNQLLEKVSYLNYLGCEISKENDIYIYIYNIRDIPDAMRYYT